MSLNLQERARVVAAHWPGELDVTRVLNYCALVADVDAGEPIPRMSQKEREQILAEIARIEERKTVIL
jgi:hypothetical protein